MNSALLNQIVHAVLYEGYILYPYRASSVKNQRERFTFGRVYPQTYSAAQHDSEPSMMQTECLIESDADEPGFEINVRFLQPVWREVGVLRTPISEWMGASDPDVEIVSELRVGETVYRTWQEAVEREVRCPRLTRASDHEVHPFQFQASRALEPIRDEQDRVVAVFLRRTEAIAGVVESAATLLNRSKVESDQRSQLLKVSVRVVNLSPVPDADLNNQDAVILRTFASTHTILHAHDANFISLLDPPSDLKETAAACRNIGTWPVLVGAEEKRERHTVLSSPIILYDYPQVAPESRGDLFDNTEIDEILTLRVLTMTDEEKREMRQVDKYARGLLERTEALPPQDLLKMHGTLREVPSLDQQIFGTNTRLDGVSWNDTYLKSGHRVRIRPKARADIMDMAVAGRIAVIEGVEQDAEQRIHLALVLEDDPGKDLGFLRQPGHRFFYGLDEVEPLEKGS